MGIYPGPDTARAPRGIVKISFLDSGDIEININTNGMAKKCSTSNENLNGCGIHIHEGKVCDDYDEIGFHYWRPMSADDPWGDIRYQSNSKGTTQMTIIIPDGNGYTMEENDGHAVVMHDADGNRISCGILGKMY